MPKKLDPKLAEKIMLKVGLKPLEPYKGANFKWRSKCLKCKKIVSPSFATVNFRKSGCKFCAGSAVDPIDAKNLMLRNDLKPLEKYVNVHHKWKCKCLKCGKLVNVRYNHVKQGVSKCAYCSKSRVDPKDAIKRISELGYETLDKYVGAHKKVRVRCLTCKNVSEISYAHINHKNQRCYYCKKNRPRINISSAKKNLAKKYKLLEPIKPGKFRSKAVCLKCKNEVLIGWGQKSGRNGCPYCTGQLVNASDALTVMKSRGFEPLEPFKGSHRKWKSKHSKCENIVFPTYHTINQRKPGSGCKYCSGVFVDPNAAVRFMLSNSLQPLTPYPGAARKWKCKCTECNKISTPQYSSVRNGSGCKFCAIQGLNFNNPAFIYLITHPFYDALKIGIGNKNFRIKQHTGQGWEVIKVWNYRSGFKASEIEQKILLYLRHDLKLVNALSHEQMPQKGHTETFSLDDISVTHVRDLIEKLSKVKYDPF